MAIIVFGGIHSAHEQSLFSHALTLIITPPRSSTFRRETTSQFVSFLRSTTNNNPETTIYDRNDDDEIVNISRPSPPPLNLTTTDTATTTTFSFMDGLVDRVRRNDTGPVTFVGYVTAKRSLSKNFIFLDLCTEGRLGMVDGDFPPDISCQALLRKEHYIGLYFDWYVKCALHKGTKLRLIGRAVPTRNPGNAVLSVQSINGLLGVPRQAQHLEGILREISLDDGRGRTLPLCQVAKACNLDEDYLRDRIVQAERIETVQKQQHQQQQNNENGGSINKRQKTMKKTKNTIIKPFRDLAKHILNDLDDDPFYPTSLVDDRLVTKRGGENGYGLPPPPLQWKDVPSTVLSATTTTTTAPVLPNEGTVISGVDGTCTVQTILGYYYDGMDEELCCRSCSTSRFVSVEGWIQNRRRFQNDITVVVLVDAGSDDAKNTSAGEDYGDRIADISDNASGSGRSNTVRLECVLHPEAITQNVAAVYRTLVAVGGKISIFGYLIPNIELNKVTVWATAIRLIQSSDQPVAIYHLLDVVRSGDVGLEEAAEALLLPHSEMEELVAVGLSPTEQKWKANQLSETLQRNSRHPTRKGLAPEQMEMVEKYGSILRQYPVRRCRVDRSTQRRSNRTASSLAVVSTMSGMPAASRWETKKRPQIEWMIQQIQRVLMSHPDFGKRTLQILDIGGGKGLLANNLARSIDNVHIQVVDVCEGAVANGRKKAERTVRASNSNQSVINFQRADASSASDLEGVEADVVVALHACGHLTDVALAHAVQRRAGFVISPCCFKSNRHLTLPTQPGWTSLVHEWHGIPENDWAMLKTVAEIQGDIATSSIGMKIICGLRAASVEQKLDTNGTMKQREGGGKVEILAFPIEYSTRNLVLVGQAPSQ